MSEYQYYEFRAVDSIEPPQLTELRALSIRAQISSSALSTRTSGFKVKRGS